VQSKKQKTKTNGSANTSNSQQHKISRRDIKLFYYCSSDPFFVKKTKGTNHEQRTSNIKHRHQKENQNNKENTQTQ
jgi:hypothetical protein